MDFLTLFHVITSLTTSMDFMLDLSLSAVCLSAFLVWIVLALVGVLKEGKGVARRRERPWIFWMILMLLVAPGVSAAMGSSSAEEVKRAAERGKFLLPADRVIGSQTRDYRRVLISRFRAWLWKEHSVSFHGLLSLYRWMRKL